MSHTTTLRGVQIKDRRAIEQAVADLKAAGVNIVLKTDAVPRMYYEHQAREVGKCDYVLHLPNSRYDVGLKWNEKEGQFDAILDTYARQVSNEIGAMCPLPVNDYGKEGEHAIGRFTQRYGINAAKNVARTQYPMASVSESMDDQGNVHLMVEGI